ncbi:MAG: DUF922 domain-containing Zn-dependent protease [Burkholderiales bacterium]
MKRACLIALSCSIGAANAEPAVTVETDYYSIIGTSAHELRRQMHLFGPKDSGGAYDAYTRWNVRWSYHYRQGNGQCAIARVATSADVAFTLPNWKNSSEGPRELQQKWRDYLSALQQHEEGHKTFALRAAAEIEDAIAAMSAATSCADLAQKANAIGERIVNHYRQEERAYDARTRHGATQGATFP